MTYDEMKRRVIELDYFGMAVSAAIHHGIPNPHSGVHLKEHSFNDGYLEIVFFQNKDVKTAYVKCQGHTVFQASEMTLGSSKLPTIQVAYIESGDWEEKFFNHVLSSGYVLTFSSPDHCGSKASKNFKVVTQ